MRIADCADHLLVILCTELGIPHGHELGEEQDKDRHQSNALGPVILGDRSRQTFIRKCLDRRREQLRYRSATVLAHFSLSETAVCDLHV